MERSLLTTIIHHLFRLPFDPKSYWNSSWVVETYYYDSDIARLLQVGDFDMKKDAIDVSAQVDRQDIPKLFGKDSDRKL